ncbi:MAG: sugar phosphate nucleotidyltransferase [Acidimicrobiales bacterium]
MAGGDDVVGVVLAAGRGARLRPLTDLVPKALCPVGGEPLVDLAVARALAVTPVVAVNASYRRDLVAAHIEARAAPVHVSVEDPVPLGTAGALGRLRPWIDGRAVLAVNADAWHRADLAAFAAGWEGHHTRLLTVVDAHRGDWGDRRYAGAALLPAAAVAALPASPAGLWEASWRHLVPGRDLELVASGGPFFDCGTPADYLAANLAASGGRSVVGTGAVVEGTLEESVVWPGARVERTEHLRRAVRASAAATVLVR